MIDRFETRDTPPTSLALQAALLFGTRVAETILASVHVRTHQQAVHMNASDPIKLLLKPLVRGSRPHMKSGQSTTTNFGVFTQSLRGAGASCHAIRWSGGRIVGVVRKIPDS